MFELVIIGGVAAGATAAARARRLSKDAKITLLEAGGDISFANCGLPYFIGGDIESRSKLILQSPESFHDQYDVDVRVLTEALSIDRHNRVVHFVDHGNNVEGKLHYDALILAQGGRPILPPLPGIHSSHVFPLWTLHEMDAIHQHIENTHPQNAVVVGGGFIGLEMVEALVKRGIHVSVVERLPHVMNTLIPEMSGYLTEELLSHGVEVVTGQSVIEIHENTVTLDHGDVLDADMVLMSVGTKPTLSLAAHAGLSLGATGALAVNEELRTSDPHIWAAGDMAEIKRRVDGKEVRVPLAGPANRQGRLAAGNALGRHDAYAGSLATSAVKIFDAVAGSTGLSLEAALASSLPAEAVTVHKENHVTYYPGAKLVSLHVVYNRETGHILGAQVAGDAGAERRLDVLATAIAGGLTVSQLTEVDLAYSPPLGAANDVVNVAGFAAENRLSGYSPALTAAELDSALLSSKWRIVDLRDVFSQEREPLFGAEAIPFSHLEKHRKDWEKDQPILLVSENGKDGHKALRKLLQAGFLSPVNVSGGYRSLERHQRVQPFVQLDVGLKSLDNKTISQKSSSVPEEQVVASRVPEDQTSPLVVDVRTPGEFGSGAVPGAVNLPLDELMNRISELGEVNRDITVYCASGARSAYAKQILQRAGFQNVENGGGLMEMMYR